MPTLDVRTRARWRAWLQRHHGTATEIWLVFHKRHTAKPGIDYEASIEEALCFGWVDSLVRRLDDDRFARRSSGACARPYACSRAARSSA
jgi:uncharacterized protein YdeI (YjbR/CyaY-like superfamily)